MTDVPQKVVNREHKIRYIRSKKFNNLIMRIWRNESTWGTNEQRPEALHIQCRNKGKVNEFGYNPQEKQCFDTWEKGIDRVEWQLQRYHDRGLTTDEAKLRLYSNGGYGI